MRRWILGGSLLAALVAAAAYFGSELGGGEGAARPPEHPAGTASGPAEDASFSEEANALCERIRQELAEIRPPAGPDQTEDYLARLIPLNRRWNDEVSELAPPPGKGAEVARLLGLLEEDERLYERLLAALRRRDGLALDGILSELADLSRRQDRAWIALGARGCTSDAFAPGVGSSAPAV